METQSVYGNLVLTQESLPLRYRCWDCGLDFDEPHVIHYRQPMPDGYNEWHTEIICPYCGSPDIKEDC